MKKYTTVNPPPEGDKEVGEWAWERFLDSKREKDRLKLPDRWKYNHKLYRGDPWGGQANTAYAKHRVAANLFFANVQRTVANITARNPVAEAIDLDGLGDGIEKKATVKIKEWWKNERMQDKLKITTTKMEKYGITIEKPYWSGDKPGVTVVDPYAYFPAPGYWEDISTDAPYIAHAMPEEIETLKQLFDYTGDIEPDDVYSILGEDREENRPAVSGSTVSSGNYQDTMHPTTKYDRYATSKALVVELWCRDNSEKYIDGVRVITITSQGKAVLSDIPNPNINKKNQNSRLSMAWGRFPFYTANSYVSTIDNWGFSAAEQVGDLLKKINELLTRLAAYASRVMFPPLIIPPNSGLTANMITNKPNLVLFPTSKIAADGIRFVPIPPIPREIFTVFQTFLDLHDRVYSIEDADRGNVPGGVKAASAIIALQERNAVLIQFKINACDFLVEQRGKWAISFWQNFGTKEELIDVNDTQETFLGVELAGRRFAYVVESGSTMPRTNLQIEEQSIDFYNMGVIDRQAVLENTNYPGWKKIVERVGEGQLGQALQILIQAGLPEEEAMALQQYLMQTQGGPGDKREKKRSQPANPEMPKA